MTLSPSNDYWRTDARCVARENQWASVPIRIRVTGGISFCRGLVGPTDQSINMKPDDIEIDAKRASAYLQHCPSSRNQGNEELQHVVTPRAVVAAVFPSEQVATRAERPLYQGEDA